MRADLRTVGRLPRAGWGALWVVGAAAVVGEPKAAPPGWKRWAAWCERWGQQTTGKKQARLSTPAR